MSVKDAKYIALKIKQLFFDSVFPERADSNR